MPRRLSFSRGSKDKEKEKDGESDEPTDEPPGGNAAADASPPQARKSSSSRIGSALKRPLSSLLRRPGSRSGSRERGTKESGGESVEQQQLDAGETKARPSTAAPKKASGQWSNGDILNNEHRKAPLKKGARPSTALSLRGGVAGGMIEIPDAGTIGMSTGDKEIPQIEDITGYEFGGEIANAPSMAMTNMQDLNLENKILQHPVFTSLDSSIDLSLMLKHVIPEKDAADESQPWSWDILFTSVSGEIAANAASKRIDNEAGDDDLPVGL